MGWSWCSGSKFRMEARLEIGSPYLPLLRLFHPFDFLQSRGVPEMEDFTAATSREVAAIR